MGGREGKRFRTGGCGLVRVRNGMAVHRVCGAVLGGNAMKELIVMVVSRWLWVAGLRRCARGEKNSKNCKFYWNGGVELALGGRFAALCLGEMQ